jgi:gamma-glutamylputrescine oxidase
MQFTNTLNYSYWEKKLFFKTYDLIVLGAGIVGLSTALSFKKKFPRSRILVLEKSFFPAGASIKNAGFACFGSAGEVIEDLRISGERTVGETVQMRWKGLNLLRKRIGDRELKFYQHGGFEVFTDTSEYELVSDSLPVLNRKMKDWLGLANCYSPIDPGGFGFSGICGAIRNAYEGQLDSAALMRSLTILASTEGIMILTNMKVQSLNDEGSRVVLESSRGLFSGRKAVIATNGFANELIEIPELKPARAQVLITEPVENLRLRGAFHYQQGYYYFRNVGKRILLGGGRNLDPQGETTTDPSLNPQIQSLLDKLLREVILPYAQPAVSMRWTGIMGVGPEKKPILKLISPNLLAAVRMGGMGIAIGTEVGEMAAEMLG